nr:Arsenical pump-driving ATPase [Klebsiella pneumoniae]
MLMGKGGVGKTTMAAAIAISLADKGFDVHLTTSDPAAHLSTTLNGSLKICRSAESTLKMKPNAIVSMFWRRRAGILMRPESGCSKRIYVLLAQKRLRCSVRSHA